MCRRMDGGSQDVSHKFGFRLDGTSLLLMCRFGLAGLVCFKSCTFRVGRLTKLLGLRPSLQDFGLGTRRPWLRAQGSGPSSAQQCSGIRSRRPL